MKTEQTRLTRRTARSAPRTPRRTFEQLENRLLMASTPTSDLVGAWSFEEGSGVRTDDLSGADHTGFLVGARWSNSGKFGKSIRFDGIDDSVETGAWDVASDQLTIAAWFRADDFDVHDARLVSKASGVAENDHFWMLSTVDDQGTKLRFRLRAGDVTETLIADHGRINPRKWHHAAATYDGSMMTLYLDGEEVGSMPHSGQVAVDPDVRVTIGNNPVGARPFDGRIDQVKIYDRALSSKELADVMEERAAVNTPPVANAGADQQIFLPGDATLSGVATDDGLPESSTIDATWRLVSGPQQVVFSDSKALDSTVAFAETGTYVLELEVSDGEFSDVDQVTLAVAYPTNQAPTVDAGGDLSVAPGKSVSLAGTVDDDRLATNQTIATADLAFSLDQSLGLVSYGNYFENWAGEGEKWLNGDDFSWYYVTPGGSLYQWDAESETSQHVAFLDPSYHQSPELLYEARKPMEIAQLAGTLSVAWSVVSGPGTVDFSAADSAVSAAAFSEPGQYVLQLRAADGEFVATDQVAVTVSTPSPAGLVGAWDFSEANGSTTADASGSGRDGVIVGAAWRESEDGAETYLDFDGVNDQVNVGNWDVDSDAITLAAWIRADDFGVADARIISKASGVNEQDHYWMLSTIEDNGQKLRFRLKANGLTETLIAGQGALQAGQWTHVAAVYDNATMRLYVDGAEVGSMPHSGVVSTNGNVPIAIGNNPDGSRPFDGQIDQVRVYDRALSPADLADLIAERPVPNQSPVVDAGPDRTATPDTPVLINASVSDDGLPDGSSLSTHWQQTSGPAAVAFNDPTVIDATATFPETGVYVLQLQVDDGQATATDTITVNVSEEQQLTGFFVSPTAGTGGDGSIDNPWSLEHALSQPSAVRPGDTIWLRGGTYRGGLTSTLQGTAEAPIVVRAYPGERVTLDLYDGQPLTDVVAQRYFRAMGAHTWFWGMEITSSDPTSRVFDNHQDSARGRLIDYGDHNRFINLVVHDLDNGILAREEATGGQYYGMIVYNNGRVGTDRPHGHGIYGKNEGAVKTIAENIVFHQFADGIDLYGGNYGNSDYHLVGNVSFNQGAANGVSYSPNRDLMVGGPQPASNIEFVENYTYQNDGRSWVDVGYKYGSNDNVDVRLTDNYFVGQLRFRKDWDSIVSNGNTVVGSVDASGLNGGQPSGISVVGNPTSNQIFVRPNAYDEARAHVVAYNWEDKSSVDVDLSGVLSAGETYEVHHVFDLYGTPVATGQYDGNGVSIPMNSMVAPRPRAGQELNAPVSVGPEFGVFVVTRTGSGAPLLAATEAVVLDMPASTLDAAQRLDAAQLDALQSEAINRWTAVGISQTQEALLRDAVLSMADLDGPVLATAGGNAITLDLDAAGHGWFVDPTPALDEEFAEEAGGLVAPADSEASGRMDLLSVVMHELGHLLGAYHDAETSAMSSSLTPGVRQPLTPEMVDRVF